MSAFRICLAALIGGAIVLFAMQNEDVVELNFMIWSLSAPRSLILIGTFASGVFYGILLTLGSQRSARKKKKRKQAAKAAILETKPAETA